MESKFKVGDVVNITDDPNRVYVVNESVLIDTGDTTRYVYEVSPMYNVDKIVHTCEESSLILQYHDVTWEQCFTESFRHRSLPPWRGELYNFYTCYVNIDKHTVLDKATVSEYENHTIPPRRMEHILKSHSIYERMSIVVLNSGNPRRKNNRMQIAKNLNIDDSEIDYIVDAIQDKINARNKNDLNPKNLERADKRNPDFSDKEYQFIDEIDRLDLSKGKMKDYFPAHMTNLQIMDAIKEVYTSKELIRIDDKQICVSKGAKNDEEEDLDASKLGKTHYRGHSDRYGFDIEFLYNFDYDFIETAYPLRMNNNAKKH